jgi:hypothetical protein
MVEPREEGLLVKVIETDWKRRVKVCVDCAVDEAGDDEEGESVTHERPSTSRVKLQHFLLVEV